MFNSIFIIFCFLQNFTHPQVIEQMAYVLIVCGAVMFVLSFLGYCGAIRESRCLLTTVGLIFHSCMYIVHVLPFKFNNCCAFLQTYYFIVSTNKLLFIDGSNAMEHKTKHMTTIVGFCWCIRLKCISIYH